MRVLGIVCIVVAAIGFTAGLIGVVSGNEVALLAMIAAFGVVTFGTGALAASRRS